VHLFMLFYVGSGLVLADLPPKEFRQMSIKKISKPEKWEALHRIRLSYRPPKMEILFLSLSLSLWLYSPFAGFWQLFQILNPIHSR
jgi:hypothetical protein